MARKEVDKKAFNERYNENKPSPKLDFKNYRRLRVIGTGGFGIVFLVHHKSSGKFYACKRLEKVRLIRQRQTKRFVVFLPLNCCFPFAICTI